jgi:hypothetical protein
MKSWGCEALGYLMVLRPPVEGKSSGNCRMVQRSPLNNTRIIQVRPNGIVGLIIISMLPMGHLINDCCPESQYLVVKVYHEGVDYFYIR